MRIFNSTPLWCRNLAVFATLASFLAMVTCGCDADDDLGPSGVIGGGGPGLVPDAGAGGGEAGPDDRPLRSYCASGERRCLFENSPLYEECAGDGHSFEVASCGPSQMCDAGRCVDFSCTPGESICIGTRTPAACAEDGRSYREAAACTGDSELCRSGECVDACEAAAREQSYIGCEYLARELPNSYRLGGEADKDSPFAVVVANPDRLLDTRVTITTADGEPAELIEEIAITGRAGGSVGRSTTVRSEVLTHESTTPITSPARDVSVPPQAAAVFLLDPGTVGRLRAYRVSSTRPIIAYQFSPYCCNITYTNDASLLLPTTTLGERYRVLGYPSMADPVVASYTPGTMTVVADQDETVVHIDSPVALLQSRDGFPREAYEEGPVRLDAGESITVGTATSFDGPRTHDRDLSGTVVEADKPVAVYAGHECTFVPQDEWACDHLEEQMLPSSTLGERYLLMPTRKRGAASQTSEKIYWRILADEDAAVRFSPPLDELGAVGPSNDATSDCRELARDGIVELAAGELCEFGALSPVSVDSSGALVVGGVISGYESTGRPSRGARAGDPSFFLAPPVEQFRQNYSFVSPPTFAGNYVAVAVPHGGAVALDGVAIPDLARLELRQVDLAGKTWDVYNVAIEAGYHTMESNQRFGIVVYAYDDYVSYAFPGGLDLLPKGSR